jgi:hypothetical protein
MANRWKGNFVVATEATSSGTDYTGKANGAWGLNSQLQQKQAGLWAKAQSVPSTPVIGTAVGGDSQVTVNFTGSTGGGTITYTATSSPGNFSNTGSSSPIIVAGLTNGTSYTFTVTAANAVGTSSPSAASNAVSPAPTVTSTLLLGLDVGSGVAQMAAYPWSSATGFGVKYSNPSVNGNGAQGCKFTHDNGNIVTGGWGSPFISAYKWSTNGFGAKYSNPSSTPTAFTEDLDIRYDDSIVVLASNEYPSRIPFIAYNWNNTTGFGSRITSPSLASADSAGISFNPAGTVVACSSFSLGVFAYAWSGGFGSKYANSADTIVGRDVAFNNNGTALAVSKNGGINIYPWSSGFGTKYSNVAPAPVDTTSCCNFSATGAAIGYGSEYGMRVYAFNTSTGPGTKYADPSTAPTGWSRDIVWKPDNSVVAVGHQNSPYVSVYPWNDSTGFGTKFADPATSAGATGFDVAFSYIT